MSFFLQAMSFTLIDTQAVTNPPIELQILQFLELNVVINSLTWRKQELSKEKSIAPIGLIVSLFYCQYWEHIHFIRNIQVLHTSILYRSHPFPGNLIWNSVFNEERPERQTTKRWHQIHQFKASSLEISKHNQKLQNFHFDMTKNTSQYIIPWIFDRDFTSWS